MPDVSDFQGFPKEMLEFLQNLTHNNNREWFNEHKDVYRTKMLEPAQAFVMVMGARLRSLYPTLIADERTNGAGSIFRIYRDARFSRDKTPYKTHLGILFWQGSRKKIENPGFYFQLEPGRMMLAAGVYEFPRKFIETFRQAVVDKKLGSSLVESVRRVEAAGDYTVERKHYKRIPAGYDPSSPNVDYLRYNALYAYTMGAVPEECYSQEIMDYCFDRFRAMSPIMDWLFNLM